MNAIISSIQHFSVGDGDGIRTTVFFKGCNLRCPWCHNPEMISPAMQVMRFEAIGREQLCGVPMPIEDIVDEVLHDKAYYEKSGGGVTLSGGEVLLQAKAAALLCEMLAAQGVSVIIDTAGCVSYSAFETVAPYADEYYFDLKAARDTDYRAIGGDLDLVLSNLRRLIADGKKVHVRIPLIPGFNTDEAYIDEMCARIGEIGATKVDLLPFHRLGSAKYEALGLLYAYRDVEPFSRDEIDEIAKLYGRYFDVKVER